jgi:hypothetical protein
MGAAVQDRNPGAYAELLREEYFVFSRIGDAQLYHWVSSEHHEPFYFQELVQLLREAGLQFLSDTDPTRLFGPREPEEVRAFLEERQALERQQHVDFLTNCTSRGILVCHRDVPLHSRADEDVLRDAWLSLATTPRAALTTPNESIQEALSRLQERRPEFVAVDDFVGRGPPPVKFFLDAFAAGMIDVVLSPPRIAGRISDRPEVSRLVRLQAGNDSTVTNQKSEPVRLTEVARHVVTLLDGVHDKTSVVESVAEMIRSGGADDCATLLAEDALDAGRLVEGVLRHLRDHALLVA